MYVPFSGLMFAEYTYGYQFTPITKFSVTTYKNNIDFATEYTNGCTDFESWCESVNTLIRNVYKTDHKMQAYVEEITEEEFWTEEVIN